MKTSCRLFMSTLMILGSVLLYADSDTSKNSTELNIVIATTKEAKVSLKQTAIVPFLNGSGPLTADNSVQFKLGVEISPVSANGTFEITWTPIAFLQAVIGSSVGSGWNIPIANGLRMNEEGEEQSSELRGDAFSGLVWSAKAGGVFQFDFAAIAPGDWNHIVFRSYQGVQYRAFTAAKASDSWLYEADSGENRNGLNYYGNYFLGYKMPIMVNTVGFLLEQDLYLYDTPGRKQWGDDLPRWTFGPLVNFTVNKKLSAALMIQGHSMRNFTRDTKNNGFYQERRIKDQNQLRIEFYRAAVIATLKLR